jgi:ABC-type antimicrobial peptide transport system permease subunit
MSEQLDKYYIRERSAAFILGILGPFALVLAAIGLYGVISHSMVQRLPEFGIRMALGASSAAISKMIIREGLILALIGLGIGISFSLALSKIIASRLHGFSPLDPITYFLVLVLCLAVAFSASILCTRKARVHPYSLLRNQ